MSEQSCDLLPDAQELEWQQRVDLAACCRLRGFGMLHKRKRTDPGDPI